MKTLHRYYATSQLYLVQTLALFGSCTGECLFPWYIFHAGSSVFMVEVGRIELPSNAHPLQTLRLFSSPYNHRIRK
jgi:hypothetical protein